MEKTPEVPIPALNENWMTMAPEANRQVLDFGTSFVIILADCSTPGRMQQNQTTFAKSRNYIDTASDEEDRKDEPDLRVDHEVDWRMIALSIGLFVLM
jgi:hypothetical protein